MRSQNSRGPSRRCDRSIQDIFKHDDTSWDGNWTMSRGSGRSMQGTETHDRRGCRKMWAASGRNERILPTPCLSSDQAPRLTWRVPIIAFSAVGPGFCLDRVSIPPSMPTADLDLQAHHVLARNLTSRSEASVLHTDDTFCFMSFDEAPDIDWLGRRILTPAAASRYGWELS